MLFSLLVMKKLLAVGSVNFALFFATFWTKSTELLTWFANHFHHNLTEIWTIKNYSRTQAIQEKMSVKMYSDSELLEKIIFLNFRKFSWFSWKKKFSNRFFAKIRESSRKFRKIFSQKYAIERNDESTFFPAVLTSKDSEIVQVFKRKSELEMELIKV